MSCFPIRRLRIFLGVAAAFSISAIIMPTAPQALALPAAVGRTAGDADARALFCAYGSVAVLPVPLPPGFESQFAVAVVEINNPSQTKHVAVSDFVLFDQAGKQTGFKRVVKVEEFNQPRIATEGAFAYYLNTTKASGTRPWNGTLSAGKTRLRIRVALAEAPVIPVRFRLNIGRYVIEGPVDGSWPT